ncbi:MAG TPA: sigma-54 dependent transcriptional regulator [Thermoanaerobaculia bacterium]|jgi:two-component system nitrogen regulation response regulator GlnG|nr:sigma-54 dependent transcriptional regulator [Thermoanaerobaculia bacterium]
MKSPRFDGSTLDLSRTGTGVVGLKGDLAFEPIPTLTILFHPQALRVGARAYLGQIVRGQEARLSRLEPDFEQPGSNAQAPLNDPYLSRRPIRFLPVPGGIEIRLDEGHTRIVLNGEPVDSSRVISLAEIRKGAVLEMAGLVVLLLHLFVPPRLPVFEPHGLVGESSAIAQVRAEIHRVADLAVPVLIRGATGTGKELVAQAIHAASRRSRGPFLSVNLGAIPPSLAASELFGAARGAFTGAVQAQDGYFRKAQGGTLFLDEIGETPQEVQASLLRVLEVGEIQPVGAQSALRVDVRALAATDADLEQRVQAGTFREPLLHRLAGYSIWLPPLRERRDDIGRLLIHFLRQELAATGELEILDRDAPRLLWMKPALVVRLARYDWPGNVRQLRNAVRQLVIGSRGLPQLQSSPGFESLLGGGGRPVEAGAEPPAAAPAVSDPAPSSRPVAARRKKPADISQDELLAVLRANRWRLKRAAEELGISRPSLYVLIERCPAIHKAGDLKVEEIVLCHRECEGDLDLMIERLMVSRDALQRRIRELGLVS